MIALAQKEQESLWESAKSHRGSAEISNHGGFEDGYGPGTSPDFGWDSSWDLDTGRKEFAGSPRLNVRAEGKRFESQR